MSVEIIVIDDNAVMIKGLRSAKDNNAIALDVAVKERKEANKYLKEINFRERAFAEIIKEINWASERGKFEVRVSAYGNGSSAFRTRNAKAYEIMEEIIKSEIFPIFRQQGYRCKLTRNSFATNEKYFNIDINW